MLVRGPALLDECAALAAAAGGRAGLDQLLLDLSRSARPLWFRRGARGGFRWDRADSVSRRWWPQGITSSADVDPSGWYAGRRLLVTTAYSKAVDGLRAGARITVVDVTDPEDVRYEHVLLVAAALDEHGRVALRPVRIHAGGAVWCGGYLHVAGTARGIYSFRLGDIVRTQETGWPTVLGVLPDGRVSAYEHRYVLPLHRIHGPPRAGKPVRFSFLSLARTPEGSRLLAGEYGRGGTPRLLTYPLAEDGQLETDTEARVRPCTTSPGVRRMQGAVLVDGRIYATTSAGRRRGGSVWSGEPGVLREHPRVLPAGPEDLCHSPGDDVLWTLTEYPFRRGVRAYDRTRFDSDRSAARSAPRCAGELPRLGHQPVGGVPHLGILLQKPARDVAGGDPDT